MGIPMNMRWTVIAAATGLGIEGLGSAFIGPGGDFTVITAAWVVMVLKLADQANVDMQRDKALKIVGAILLGLASFLGGAKLGVQAFSLTGIGTLPAMLANLGINALVTYLAGTAIAGLFHEDNRISSVEAFARAVVAAVLAALGLSYGTS